MQDQYNKGYLPQNELLGLMDFGMGSSLQKVMILQDFLVIVDHTIFLFIKFFESRLEHTKVEAIKEKKVCFDGDNISKKKR